MLSFLRAKKVAVRQKFTFDFKIIAMKEREKMALRIKTHFEIRVKEDIRFWRCYVGEHFYFRKIIESW
jgi:hypothetical protein